MAQLELNPMFGAFSGRICGIVLYRIKGNLFARRYVVPGNPDTEKQRENRNLFASAVKAWQSLSEEEKGRYNEIVAGRKKFRNGYNYFISQYMRGGTDRAAQSADISLMDGASIRSFSSLHKAGRSVTTPLSKALSNGKAPFWPDTGS